MNPYCTLLDIFEINSIDTETTITQSTNNGGAVTFQISDALMYIWQHQCTAEIDFLLHLNSTKELTPYAVEHMFKHFFFDHTEAKRFVR